MRNLIISMCVLFIIPMIIWWFVFGDSVLSHDGADWSYFGGFVGGVLSPVFSLLSVIYVYFGIVKSDKNSNKQIDFISSQNRMDQILKLSEVSERKLDVRVDKLIPRLRDAHAWKFSNINIYDDETNCVDLLSHSVGSILVNFHLSKVDGKKIKKSYVDLIGTISFGAQSCLCRLFDFVLLISNDEEFERAVDLVEAVIDINVTIALIEFNLESMRYNDKSPLLERLERINSRTKFLDEFVSRYIKIIKLARSSAKPQASSDDVAL